MPSINIDEIQRIREVLKPEKNVVITSHHNPDGDAVGSMLGLYHILLEMGIKCKMLLPNDIPDFLLWLPAARDIIRYSKQKKITEDIINNADVLFALDFNSVERLEKLSNIFKNSTATKVLIDHHPQPQTDSFHIIISQINVSSTAELVFELAHVLDNSSKLITYNSAISILTGIITDTGSFSYACSYPRTFEICSKLIEKGVNVDEVQKNVYNNFSEDRMRLLGHSLVSKMKVFKGYNSAYITLTRDELNRFKYSFGDTEGLVNYPLSIRNMVLSALFIENTNYIKVSLRSRGNFPANKICEEYFNGGGHLNAAGGKSYTSMEETEKIFARIIEKYQKELNQ